MKIEIRQARPEDAPVIAEYNRAMAAETESLTLEPGRVIAGVKSVFDDPSRGLYLVAAAGGQVVGQLMITYEWSDWRNGSFWWIQSVYVHPDYRRRGVFRMLYSNILERARQAPDVCGVRLYVEEENHRAQRTYKELGMSRTPYQFYEVDFVLGKAAR